MNFFITLTTGCDLKCRYCYGECYDDFNDHNDGLDIDYFIPERINYDTEALKKFIEKDPEATVIFYGGEPLLEIDKMKELMDVLHAKRFLLHTNGMMLDRLEPEYINRLPTISISIDGDESLTDYYRGMGVYAKIRDNIRQIRENGYRGEMIARMTVMEQTDIYGQVNHLLNSPELSFDSVHWQLNALFWYNDYKRREFSKWATQSYNPGIQALIGQWVDTMRKEGRVLKIYPFLGVMRSMLTGESSLLRCGAGWAEFNIQTDGNISPCPVMSGLKDFYAGNIFSSDPYKLDPTYIAGPCKNCDVLDICGGRCLYSNVTMKWGEKGFFEVCSTIKYLLNALRETLPEVKDLIDKGRIEEQDFEFVKFNSCEIIP
ncbi:radical SAM/SPASM domain-containing protein [Methanocella sp. CWC-04]|uniref:Radical SAM/SPASM domain-containing protein n=1 Tax=Methanooceanicella nereidis TaxID=2052831 RepID=A0AAP2W6G3_9EURY|nr:radical SAM/SPASM domain-containing protein [Methanocella sp. CWC-04]